MVMAVNGNGKERIENFGLPEKNWKNEFVTKMIEIATKKNLRTDAQR
jgi:hypothetical protein